MKVLIKNKEKSVKGSFNKDEFEKTAKKADR